MSYRIGVVGPSKDGSFDSDLAQKILEEELGLLAVSHEELTLVSGLTDMGVPGLAYKVGSRLGMSTVGVACSKALEMKCFPCDEVLIVGKEWGDESETFLNRIDELLQLGSSPQATREFKQFQGPKIRRDLPLIE